MELVEEIEETGSGARNDRPGLRRVLELARRHQVEAVLTWKVDRFARSVLDLCTNVRELVEVHGCAFYAVSQGLVIKPGGEATSRLLLNILGAVSEFEREIIRERTRLGLSKARSSGKVLGRPSRKLSPAQAELVRQLRSQGHSWSQVAEEVRCRIWAARQAAETAASPA
jgi:DNA invertase Pin-like site-specific DNA recombinase